MRRIRGACPGAGGRLMYTLLQSLNCRGEAGQPLPQVFKSLSPFIRGQLALICGGPGTGKSAFALTYALRSKVPTLYLSADSDAFIQLSRSVSILTGARMEASFSNVLDGSLGVNVEAAMAELPVRFNYNACPSLDQIETSMKSYEEVYGDYPELVVVDNVTNVRGGGDEDDPFSGLEALMDYLHTMARSTGSCVIGLHHVTGGYNDADKAIPLSGVKGQISRVPEMILTMHRLTQQFGADLLRVSTVKNRGGKADPSGLDWVELEFSGDTMQIRG